MGIYIILFRLEMIFVICKLIYVYLFIKRNFFTKTFISDSVISLPFKLFKSVLYIFGVIYKTCFIYFLISLIHYIFTY